MKLKIYIPSTQRSGRLPTLNRIPLPLQHHVYLVVPPKELREYEQNKLGASVLVCPAKGIAATRDWILGSAVEMGHTRIVMLDDDLVLQRKRNDGKITNLEGGEYRQAFRWLEDRLGKYAHASFGPRFLGYDGDEKEAYGKRAMYVLGYNVEKVAELGGSFTKGMPEMPVMEDFHMTLQLLKAGEPNVLSMVWRVSPYAANAPGGCSTWRTLKRHNRSAERLAKLHAPFVTLRKADTLWQGQQEHRLEVTVQWQQALKNGQARNRLRKELR